MLDIQWGDFIFKAEGTVAVLIAAIPLMLVIQIPHIQRLIHTVLRKARSSRLASDIGYRVRKLEKK